MNSKILVSVVIAIFATIYCTEGFEFLDVIPGRLVEKNTKKVLFFLYPTKRSQRFRQELVAGDIVSLEKSSFNKSRPVVFLTHGFISDSMDSFEQNVKDAYQQTNTEVNVITVDWSKLATPNSLVPEAWYAFAALNVPHVGKKVAELLVYLLEEGFIESPKDIHLVGHSLGAHVSGAAGSAFKAKTGFQVARITGLDPAGPTFMTRGSGRKLDQGDAEFVDVIHSNAGFLGYYGDLGHVDFWPNGGTQQPNCTLIPPVVTTAPCDHSASHMLFAKSIRDPTITACKCQQHFQTSSCLEPCADPILFGEHTPTDARGDYYLSISY